ncbi:hypothetical protein OIU85_006671 [Salix viminalis]|uniref:Rhomboid-like protein 19 n=1 Tax=Salix viminalis TaxID=40686 RepID=A0A9Q0PLH4_SALVM|nr:hypothetical protein OIU85_006671 [Salix viminalis]
MSSPSILGGTSLFTGFTKLCKVQILPPAVNYLALIPARTIPFVWNLITAGYIEQSIYGVVASTLCLLIMGKLLEQVWGSKEFLKFIFIVNFLISVCVFITAISLYYITRRENYLYMPISGFQGILAGFLVGIKQIIPDQELSLLRIKAKWFSSLMLLIAIAISFLYCRRKPETKLRGDPSDEFAFSSFFPEFLRPIIDPIASIFHRMLCGRFETSTEDHGDTLGGAPLPGSDPIEATRRRERGARALEERLATAPSAEELKKDAAENV